MTSDVGFPDRRGTEERLDGRVGMTSNNDIMGWRIVGGW